MGALNAAGGTDPTERCEALDAEILRIAGLSNAIEYQFIKLLAEFDELDGSVGDGVKSFAHWLNWAATEKSGENVSRETFECGCEARDFEENRAMALANIAEHFLSTSAENLITLCRHHHRALHKGEYSEAIRQCEAECRKRGITIDKHTANCRWDGEDMDYVMFIDAMYQFREKDS